MVKTWIPDAELEELRKRTTIRFVLDSNRRRSFGGEPDRGPSPSGISVSSVGPPSRTRTKSFPDSVENVSNVS